MLDLLLDLPSQLTLDLLGNWVGLKTIILLDLAYTNKSRRATYLDLLKSKELVISDNNAYSDDYSNYLIEWCLLREMKFSYFVFGSSTSDSISDETLAEFVQMTGKSLKTFGIHVFDMQCDGNRWWNAIATECSQLEELELEIAASLEPTTLTEILRRNSSTLRKVDIQVDLFEVNLPIECLFPVLVEFHARADVKLIGTGDWLQHCPHLRRFAVDVSLHDMSVLGLIKEHCKHIDSINLLNITDESVSSIIRHCPVGPALHLTFNKEIGETGIVNCVFRLKNIQSITFYYKDDVNSGCLSAIKQFCTSSLRKFSLNGCSNVTSADVLSLVAACTNLSILYINTLSKMSPKMMCRMVASCRTLTRLTCICTLKVDDATLRAIGTHLQELTYLNIETIAPQCKYTLKGVHAVVQGCPKLTTLCLGAAYHTLFTDESRAEWQALYPHLRIEHELSAEYDIDDSDEIQ